MKTSEIFKSEQTGDVVGLELDTNNNEYKLMFFAILENRPFE